MTAVKSRATKARMELMERLEPRDQPAQREQKATLGSLALRVQLERLDPQEQRATQGTKEYRDRKETRGHRERRVQKVTLEILVTRDPLERTVR